MTEVSADTLSGKNNQETVKRNPYLPRSIFQETPFTLSLSYLDR